MYLSAAINYVWGPPNEVCPAYGNTCPCYPNQCGGACANPLPSLGACPLSDNIAFTPINLCINGSITFTVRSGPSCHPWPPLYTYVDCQTSVTFSFLITTSGHPLCVFCHDASIQQRLHCWSSARALSRSATDPARGEVDFPLCPRSINMIGRRLRGRIRGRAARRSGRWSACKHAVTSARCQSCRALCPSPTALRTRRRRRRLRCVHVLCAAHLALRFRTPIEQDDIAAGLA